MYHPQYWFCPAASIYLLDMTLLKDAQQDSRSWHVFPGSRLDISLFGLLVTLRFHPCTGHWKFMNSFIFHFWIEEVRGLNHLGPYCLGPHAIGRELQGPFLGSISTCAPPVLWIRRGFKL